MSDKLRILLVDDDAIVREGLAAMLPWQELGAELAGAAADGAEAWQMAQRLKPDLVISDIRMPGMDGLALCRNLYESMPDVRIILLSAHEEFSYARTAMRYGVRSYIIKPVDRERLAQLIAEVREAAEAHAGRRGFYEMVYGGGLEEALRKAVASGDAAFLRGLSGELKDSPALSFRERIDVCTECLHLMYAMPGAEERVSMPREQALLAVRGAASFEDGMRVVREVYRQLLAEAGDEAAQDARSDSRADSLVAMALRHVADHWMDPDLSVASIASLLGITASHLSVVFRQRKGINLSSHITDVRMIHACRLLADPAIRIAEISSRIGYPDAHYFARAFKKHQGMTPSEYRSMIWKE